jgi:cysteine desulfurase/selenocysteine lyase
VNAIRNDFPILKRISHGVPLVYLDNAATTQKPQSVIDAEVEYYTMYNSNVHRAAHELAEEATTLMEEARRKAATLINSEYKTEVIFTRGTTEAINLVASSLTAEVQSGDEILITELEHHSNIVPWQMLCQRTGATLVAVAVTPSGEIDLQDFHNKLNSKTKIFACNHVSNALGTVNPIAALLSDAKAEGATTIVDGAQAILHLDVDVRELDCDFYAFSGHKMYAPTGIGILYGKQGWLEKLPPWQGGGEMIEHVTIAQSSYQRPPYKFEAGTPNIAGAVGLGAAIDYLASIDRAALRVEERQLIHLTISRLKQIPGLRLIGEPEERSAVVSFHIDGSHPHDIGTLLDQQGVAVRTGHHCAMPLMDRLGISGTVRASFSLYSDANDVDRLVQAVEKATTFMPPRG